MWNFFGDYFLSLCILCLFSHEQSCPASHFIVPVVISRIEKCNYEYHSISITLTLSIKIELMKNYRTLLRTHRHAEEVGKNQIKCLQNVIQCQSLSSRLFHIYIYFLPLISFTPCEHENLIKPSLFGYLFFHH